MRRSPVQFDNTAFRTAVDFDPISGLVRVAETEHESGKNVIQAALERLWGAGYYNATVTISLDAASLTIASSDVAAFARAAESYRNRAVAPVAIKVDPGPLFRLALDPRRQRRRR